MSDQPPPQDTKPKRIFKPVVPQRRKPPVQQSALLGSSSSSSSSSSHTPTDASFRGARGGRGGRGGFQSDRGGRGRGRGRGRDFDDTHQGPGGPGRGRGVVQAPVASGPFSMGPSLSGGRGAAGFGTMIDMNAYDPSVKRERGEGDADTDEYVDMRSVLGGEDADPVLFKVKKEETGEGKMDVDDRPSIHFQSDASTLHLIQLPPILPPFDESTLPVSVETPGMPAQLKGPEYWVDEPAAVPQPPRRPTTTSTEPEPPKTTYTRKPEGLVGRFIVRQSGRVQLVMGEHVFDVNVAPKVSFHQQLVAIDPNMHQAFNIGDIASHMICAPNLDALLASREKEIKEMGE